MLGALCAAAVDGDVRLWLDPFVDLDRTNDFCEGLLDRLGNPRSAFHVARTLNTLLASDQPWAWAAVPVGIAAEPAYGWHSAPDGHASP